ncbi:MAG: hypothetical protein BWY91_02872 [bacterium ADurb.BinA028]|nr:MAG: hypothetical protein BWY91_02872 [bacterium ADurb.BinA028]
MTTVWPRRWWARTSSRASGRIVPAIFWTKSRSPNSVIVSSLWPRIAAYPLMAPRVGSPPRYVPSMTATKVRMKCPRSTSRLFTRSVKKVLAV